MFLCLSVGLADVNARYRDYSDHRSAYAPAKLAYYYLTRLLTLWRDLSKVAAISNKSPTTHRSITNIELEMGRRCGGGM